jgi:hypothetical protein
MLKILTKLPACVVKLKAQTHRHLCLRPSGAYEQAPPLTCNRGMTGFVLCTLTQLTIFKLSET